MDDEEHDNDHTKPVEQPENHELEHLKDLYNSQWIKKNLFILSVVFCFTFLAYNGLAYLQVFRLQF